MAREQLKSLTEPMYYILLSLLRDNHGYGIMQMVEELTEGRVAIGAGTLYSLLGRFEKEGIIRQTAEENRRKIYRITEKGTQLLQEEYERLNHLVEDGKKFFDFEGGRKEPPADGDGGRKEKRVEEIKSVKQENMPEDSSQNRKEKPERQKRRIIGGGGLQYGGTC